MIFLPYDIDSAIASGNSQHKQHLQREQFAFLHALASEQIAALNCANDLLSKADQLGLIDKNSTQLLERVRVELLNDNFTAIRSCVNELKIQLDKKALHDWYVEQQRRLSNPDLWALLMTHPSAILMGPTLTKLQKQWLDNEHSQYCAHNSQSILFITQQIIPLIENYHQFANLELQYYRFRLPRWLKQDYQHHLQHEEKKLTQLKQNLCDTMLLRLEIANESGNLCYDDIIQHDTALLASQNLIKQQHGLPLYKQYGLTQNTFQDFLHFIIQHGNKRQQHQLKNLACFRTNDEFSVNYFQGGVIVMPTIFAKTRLVPRKPVLFPSLFPQSQHRFQFMQKNMWLFSNLQVLGSYNLKKHGIQTSTQHLLALEQLLQTANESVVSTTLSGWQKIFSRSTSHFKQCWQHYHETARLQLLEKKIDFVTLLYNTTRKQISLELEKDAIESLLASITPENGLNSLEHERVEEFIIMKKKILKKLYPLPSESTNPFDNLTPATSEPQEQQSVPRAEHKLLNFLNHIQFFKLDESNFEEALGSLDNISKSFHTDENEMSQTRIAELYAKIFDQYLRHCTAFKAPNAIMAELNKLTRVEEILLAHAPNYIQDRIKALREIRTKSEWFLLFMVKCRSFLASCQQQTTPFLITNSSIFSTPSLKIAGEFNDFNPQPCGVR